MLSIHVDPYLGLLLQCCSLKINICICLFQVHLSITMLSTSASGRIYSGSCPTDDCKAVIIYSDFVKDAQCWQCKLKFPITSLTDACEIRDSREALVAFWKLLTESSPSLPEPPVVNGIHEVWYFISLFGRNLHNLMCDFTNRRKYLVYQPTTVNFCHHS